MTKIVVRQGVLAAIYVVCCLILAPISFGMVQIRVAEMLMIFAFYDRRNIFGLTAGCLIANMFSPLGVIDVIFGTVGTLLVCLTARVLPRKWMLAPVAAVINGLVVGYELHYVFGLPFLLAALTVAVGEFIAVLAGVIVFSMLEKKGVIQRL